jgi:hypothetical protein
MKILKAWYNDLFSKFEVPIPKVQQDPGNKVLIPKPDSEQDKKSLANLGLMFYEDYDDHLVYVELPEGWEISNKDESYFTFLFDSNGYRRAQLYIKQSFCDRDSYIRVINNRFEIVETVSDGSAMAFAIQDYGLDRIVRKYDKITYAVHKDDPNKVGFVFQGAFTYMNANSDSHGEPIITVDSDCATTISSDEFYRVIFSDSYRGKGITKYANIAGSTQAKLDLEELPKGAYQWSTEFDYPEV